MYMYTKMPMVNTVLCMYTAHLHTSFFIDPYRAYIVVLMHCSTHTHARRATEVSRDVAWVWDWAWVTLYIAKYNIVLNESFCWSRFVFEINDVLCNERSCCIQSSGYCFIYIWLSLTSNLTCPLPAHGHLVVKQQISWMMGGYAVIM